MLLYAQTEAGRPMTAGREGKKNSVKMKEVFKLVKCLK